MAVVPVALPVLVLPVLVMREGGKQQADTGLSAAEIFQMNMAERQREIDCQRKQREQRTLPDFGAKPIHSETTRGAAR